MRGWQVLRSNFVLFCLSMLQVLEGSCSTPQIQQQPSLCFQQSLLSTSFSAAFLQGPNVHPEISSRSELKCIFPLRRKLPRDRRSILCAAGPGDGGRSGPREDVVTPYVEPKDHGGAQRSAAEGYLSSLSPRTLYRDPQEHTPMVQLAKELDAAEVLVGSPPEMRTEEGQAEEEDGAALPTRQEGRAKRRAERRGSKSRVPT